MKHHGKAGESRRAAVEFMIDARESSGRGGDPPAIDRRIADSEDRLRSFYEQIDSAEGLLAHAAAIEFDGAPRGRPSPRAIPIRRKVAGAGMLIAAAITFAVVHFSPPATRLAPTATHTTPATPATPTTPTTPTVPDEPTLLARADPLENLRELPAEEEPPALVSDPIVLQVEGLESILFAIGWRRGASIEEEIFKLDADVFCSQILPRLDPVDQWRVHQAALASRGYYPVDEIDGMYGEKTAEGLERYFSGRSVGRLIRRGLLSEQAAKVLLGEIDSIAIALPRRPDAGLLGSQNHTAARTVESVTESDPGETNPLGQTSPEAGALNR